MLYVFPRLLKIDLSSSMAEQFQNGQKVEVLKTENGAIPVWFPALVLRSAPKDQKKDKIYVELETLTLSKATGDGKPLREFVDIGNVRPAPPRELNKLFKVGEMIEAFVKNGWRKGQVLKILENSMYEVSFNEARTEELENRALRDIKEWIDGSWVPHNHNLQKNGTESEFKSKEIKIRIICSGNWMNQFSKGMTVEVRSDEEGYKGAWYTAVILGPKGNNDYLVEYQTLKTDDESEPLKETAKISDIRPCAPKIEQKEQFEMLDEVDAWYNDGWWVGVISKVFGGFKYSVYFWTSDEEYEFTHNDLRPHQEWIGGKWIVAFRKKSKLLLKSKLSKLKRHNSGAAAAAALTASFSKGQEVEVKSYEDGYRGFWYPSIIWKVLENGKYMVQYQTLRNADRKKPVEETDVECIRPSPPEIEQTGRFKTLEEVDAWHNGGWWVGQICKILKGSKYSVYFKDSDEVKEFQHAKLRPHQDWVNQHWIPANGGWMPRSA